MKFNDVRLGQVVCLVGINNTRPMIVIDKNSVSNSQWGHVESKNHTDIVTDDGQVEVCYSDSEGVIRKVWLPTYTVTLMEGNEV